MFERLEIIFGMRFVLKSFFVLLKWMFWKINGYGLDIVNDVDKYVFLGFRKKFINEVIFLFYWWFRFSLEMEYFGNWMIGVWLLFIGVWWRSCLMCVIIFGNF